MDASHFGAFLAVVATTAGLYYMKKDVEDGEGLAWKPGKDLSIKDSVVLQMLTDNETSKTDRHASWVVTDPSLPDNPIVHCSEEFARLTQYPKSHTEGKNCRFLQGRNTKPEDVEMIRKAIKDKKECAVSLLNYRKDGSTFRNHFFLAPLFARNGEVAYYVGVQCESDAAPMDKQAAENMGWQFLFNSTTPSLKA